jgi:FkbM family methyltransferase
VSAARLSKPVRKAPYYARALYSLCRAATTRSVARCLLRREQRLDLRSGDSLRLDCVLDLLVLQEALIADVYRLADLGQPRGSAIVDVGAGIGAFTLAAARRFPRLTVYGFEPNPRTFALLQRNVRAAGLANVELAAAAIGTAGRYVVHDVAAGPRTTLAASGDADSAAVPGRRLDDVIGPGQISLLKIDTEGLELEVLESSVGVLPAVERVVVEYHRQLLADADERVAALLEVHGFDVSVRADPYEPSVGYVSGPRPGRSAALPAAGRAVR